jgi:hypothetical protein
MAAIHTQTIQIHLNKIVKMTDETPNLITEDLLASLEAVAQELVGSGIVVELDVK